MGQLVSTERKEETGPTTGGLTEIVNTGGRHRQVNPTAPSGARKTGMSVAPRIPSNGKPGNATGAAARCSAPALADPRFRRGATRCVRRAHPDARARLWQSEYTSRGWPKPTASRVSKGSARLKRLHYALRRTRLA